MCFIDFEVFAFFFKGLFEESSLTAKDSKDATEDFA